MGLLRMVGVGAGRKVVAVVEVEVAWSGGGILPAVDAVRGPGLWNDMAGSSYFLGGLYVGVW